MGALLSYKLHHSDKAVISTQNGCSKFTNKPQHNYRFHHFNVFSSAKNDTAWECTNYMIYRVCLFTLI